MSGVGAAPRAAPRDLPRPRHGRGRRRGAALPGVRRRARCGGSRCPRSGCSALPCTAVAPAPGSGWARCSGWASCCRCCAGPASTSARCRGWRSRRAEAVFVGAAGAGMAVVSRLRRPAPALGGRGVGRGRGAAGAGALRRLPVGPGRVRSARRAAAAGGRRRRGAAAVVRDGAGRARARRGRAAPRPSARCGPPPRPRCWRSSRSRPARWPRCCRPRGRLPSRTVTIAAVQGNVPRLGLDFNAQRRAVLDNHVRVTEQLAADVAAGLRPRPDLVLWPENSSDIDPLRNPDAAAAIDRAARAVGVPIVLGTVLVGEPGPDGTLPRPTRCWSGSPASESSTAPTSGGCSPSASTCRGGRSSGCFATTSTGPATSCPGPGAGAVDAAGVRVGDRDLLGGRLRRPGRRQRRRGRPGARRAEQQRHLRPQRDDLPAAGHVAGARRRARPGGARRDHQRGQRHDRPGRHRHRRDQQFHPRCAGRRNAAAGHHYARRSAAGRHPSGCCRRPDWQGSGSPLDAAAPDDGAYGRTAQDRDAQERTTMAEGPDGRRPRRCWW